MTPQDNDRLTHAKIQSEYFDQKKDIFCQPIPEAIDKRTERIVGCADLAKTARVLDVGCGTGVLFKHFRNLGIEEANIVGCDLSTGMLATCKTRYPNAKYFQGDVVDFPGSFGVFDAVFINACFGNMFNQEKALDRAKTVLKPGGKIVIGHPMGATFVKALHDNEPHIVPHLLPNKETLQTWANHLGMKLTTFIDEPLCYIACLQSAL